MGDVRKKKKVAEVRPLAISPASGSTTHHTHQILETRRVYAQTWIGRMR
ncbi:hypothetical protein N9L76_02965 [bacterium]|nr:hypothetical protein [bacterium]